MALVLDEAQAMRDAARKAGRLLQVGLLCRSIASYRHIKEIADAGTHGRLLSLATWRLGSYLHPEAPDHKAHYGDPTTELMTFDLDFATWLFGKPARVSAAGTSEITALLDYGDGRSATIAASGLMPPGVALHCRLPRPVRRRRVRAAAGLPRRPARDRLHDRRRQDGSRGPSASPAAIPTRSSCAASSTASPAKPIRRCSMPNARSRR